MNNDIVHWLALDRSAPRENDIMKTIDCGQAKRYRNVCQFAQRFCALKIQWKRNEDDKIQNEKQSKEIEWTNDKAPIQYL